jgi:hypothetical protein
MPFLPLKALAIRDQLHVAVNDVAILGQLGQMGTVL